MGLSMGRAEKVRALAVERSWEEEGAGGSGTGAARDSGERGMLGSASELEQGRGVGGTSERGRGSSVQPNSGLGPEPWSPSSPKLRILPAFGGDTEQGYGPFSPFKNHRHPRWAPESNFWERQRPCGRFA